MQIPLTASYISNSRIEALQSPLVATLVTQLRNLFQTSNYTDLTGSQCAEFQSIQSRQRCVLHSWMTKGYRGRTHHVKVSRTVLIHVHIYHVRKCKNDRSNSTDFSKTQSSAFVNRWSAKVPELQMLVNGIYQQRQLTGWSGWNRWNI